MGWFDQEEEWKIPTPRSGGNIPLPPPPANNVQTSPGFNPDYGALIRNNPLYMAWKNNAVLDRGQAASMRKEALRQLVIRYGGMGKVQDPYGDIDQGTLDLAAGNQFSDTKRLQKNYELGIEGFKKSLAARQAVDSGDLQYGLDQRDQERATSEYDIGNQFSGSFGDAINSYLGVESNIRQSELNALIAAMNAVYADPSNRPREARSAYLVPNSQNVMGYPVYQDDDGRQWWINPQTGQPERNPWDLS